MKIQQLKTGQQFITLPTQISRAKGWKKGDDLKYKINDKGELVIYK
jgi:hypothetical protein